MIYRNIILTSLLLVSKLYSLPVGNPADASLYHNTCDKCACYDFISLGFGFYGDYVFNRHLKTIHDHDIEHTELYTNAGYAVISFLERVDIFTTFGATNFFLHTNLSAFNAVDPGPRFDVDTITNFSWSIGSKATLWECGRLSVGIEGQYFSCQPDLKRLYIANGAVLYPTDLSTHYKEWQVGLGMSYQYRDILPYIAIKWSEVKWNLGNQNTIIEDNVNTFLYNLENQKSIGYAVGATLSRLYDDKMAVTVEARFVDELAVHVNGQMRF